MFDTEAIRERIRTIAAGIDADHEPTLAAIRALLKDAEDLCDYVDCLDSHRDE